MKSQRFISIAAALGMLALILDPKTGLQAGLDGVDMCIRRLIPSLFPFLMIAGLLVNSLQGSKLTLLRPLERLCRIRPGSGSILLTGFLGGYPVGARAVAQAYRSGTLGRDEAERMLGFCNNAGPSFLFGVVGGFFPDSRYIWILWALHIVSSIAAAVALPGSGVFVRSEAFKRQVSVTDTLESTVRTMGLICGWVILFRVIIGFLERWFLWVLPAPVQVLISGLLELSNGCLMLGTIQDSQIRFLLAGVMLTFGGCCVAMQTCALCDGLRMRFYYLGKIIQTGIFLLLSGNLFLLKSPNSAQLGYPVLILDMLTAAVIVFALRRKKPVAFPQKLVYNKQNYA